MLTDKVKREIDARLDRIVYGNPTFVESRIAQIQYEIECNFGSIVATNNTIMYWRAVKREGRVKDAEVNVRLAELEAKKQDYKREEEDLYSKAQKAIRDYERFYELA